MFNNGFTPIPLLGKDAFLRNWTNMTVNETVIAGWGNQHDNTGMRTAYTPVGGSGVSRIPARRM
jgi:hypothetical protein